MGQNDNYYFSTSEPDQGAWGDKRIDRSSAPQDPWRDAPRRKAIKSDGGPRGLEATVQDLRRKVERYFRISDVRWTEESAAFYFQVLPSDLDERFDSLRKDLKKDGFVPFLKEEKNEYVIYLNKKPKMNFKSPRVNLVMFFLTIFTTIWAGSILWAGYKGVELGGFSDYLSILTEGDMVLFGALAFAAPLMLILGTHELGHYVMSRKYNVDASLPFFIPVPPVFPLGTMGAFISLREPIPNKRALLAIGAAGPIVGFIVAIPVIFLGFFLTTHFPQELVTPDGGVFIFLRSPLLYSFIAELMPIPADTAMHPMAFAGWVGLFVTALNLLPAGQLDGGHIARAMLGNQAKYVSYITVFFLLIAGLFTGFGSWLIFGIFILFMGANHPPPLNDMGTLKKKHKVMGIFTVVMFILCFHPAPMVQVEIVPPDYELELIPGETSFTADSQEWSTFEITMINWGDETDTYNISIFAATFDPRKVEASPVEVWDVEFQYDKGNLTVEPEVKWVETDDDEAWAPDVARIEVEPEEEVELVVRTNPPGVVEYGQWLSIGLIFYSEGEEEIVSNMNLTTIKGTVSITAKSKVSELSGLSGGGEVTIRNEIEVMNIGGQEDTIHLEVSGQPRIWDVTLNRTELVLGPGEAAKVSLEITPMSDDDSDVEILSVEVPIRVTAISDEVTGSRSFTDILLKLNFGG